MKSLINISIISLLIFSCDNSTEPENEYVVIDGEEYYQGDLDVLNDFISLNDSLNGMKPLEIGSQVWIDNRLIDLNLYDFDLTTVPESIGDLDSLEQLILVSNQLTTIPESIGNLINLSCLWLENNQITNLPESIGNLINLEYCISNFNSGLSGLGLSHNQLTTLPESIGNLINLNELIISHNQLTTLPESICNIKENCHIDISNNNICLIIPSCFDWINNQICEDVICPQDLVFFENDCYYQSDLDVLQNLIDINENISGSIFDIGDQYWENGEITYLSLRFYQLTSLPENFGNLNNLEILNLYSNQLMTLPESIGSLINLRGLSLSNNQLSSLPNSFGNLINLSGLILSNNQLSFLPESFSDLTNMSQLYLNDNELSSLPNSFCNLNIDWGGQSDLGDNLFNIGNNNLCPPYPDCISQEDIDSQDTSDCP